MLIDSRTIYAAKLNLRVPVRLQAKKCPLLANIYCTVIAIVCQRAKELAASCSRIQQARAAAALLLSYVNLARVKLRF